jgi:hypothetical protein
LRRESRVERIKNGQVWDKAIMEFMEVRGSFCRMQDYVLVDLDMYGERARRYTQK